MNSLSDIPSGTKIIIDTNILVYFALAHEKFGFSCKEFIARLQKGDVSGFIPTIVLNELAHTLMMAELIEKGYGKNRSEAIQFMKKFSPRIKGTNHQSASDFNDCGDNSVNNLITNAWMWMDKIPDLNCTIIPEQNSTIHDSFLISRKYGLLAKDAYTAAFAKSYNVFNIATNDADFDVLPWLRTWKPKEKITYVSV